MSKQIIVAIDTTVFSEAKEIIKQLDPSICIIKIGSVAYNSLGIDIINECASKHFEIFLDLKFHDIPNTVSKSIEIFNNLPISMLTVHVSGGEQMLKSAKDSSGTIKVIGVTALTSLNNHDLNYIFQRDAKEQVTKMLHLAKKSGIDGIVCSPHEIKIVKELAPEVTVITPGIRLEKSDDDQSRVMSPAEAISCGADYIVIGRPITKGSVKRNLNKLSDNLGQ